MGDRSAFDSHRRYFRRIGPLVCGVAAAIGLIAALSADVSAQPVAVTPNPTFTARCGTLRIMLVLDESTSITAPDETLIREAANHFIDGLKDTGTELAISAFAVNARNLTSGYNLVTDATEGAFRSAIASFATGTIPGGRAGTNWDAAFRLVRGDDDTFGLTPNLVLFMTDGNPNTYVGGPPGFSDSLPYWEAATGPSITSANSVKEQGSRIFAIGLGQYLDHESGSVNRLRWISGDNEFPNHPDFSTADYTLSTDFAAFRTILSTIVSRLCGSSLVITKWVSHLHGGEWTRAPGWHFRATLDTPHDWLTPDVGTSHSASEVTNDEGVAEFHWLVPNGGHMATLGVTHETEKPGFHHVLSECELHKLGADGLMDVMPHPPGGSPTGIPGAQLSAEDFMTCDVYNAADKPGGGGGGETDVTEPEHAPHLVTEKHMPARATVGEHVPVTITVHNHGSGPAHDVRVIEEPPHGGHFVGVADHGTIESNGTVVWVIGTLAPGETRMVHATMLVTHTGLSLNTVVSDAADGDPAVDDTPIRVGPAPTPPPFTG